MNMNKKGFTLIELIVTIALLAIVAVVSFVSITGVIKESYNKECKNMETTIINATKSYVSDYRYNNNWNCDNDEAVDLTINAKKLLDEKYLTKSLRNPYTGTDINGSTININIYLDTSCNVVKVNVIDSLPKKCQG